MQVTLYKDIEIFTTLAAEWDDLLKRSVVNTVFMTRAYLKTWWAHLGQGDFRVLAVRDRSTQTLVGLAPLFVHQKEIRFIGCVDVSDYLDFLVDQDYVSQVYQAIVEFMVDNLDITWETAYFCSLPHQSSTMQAISSVAEAKGWPITLEVEEVCPVISLPQDWETYLANINKKQRHEIRRKLRKAENVAETHWYVLEKPEDLTPQVFETFVDLHQKSRTDKEAFWDESRYKFFESLMIAMAEQGWLKLYFLEIDGEVISTLLCFHYQNELLVYNSGFDPQKFSHLSPGNVIVSYSIQDAIDLKCTRYDFLRGDEEYKFRFGAVAEDVFGLRFQRQQE